MKKYLFFCLIFGYCIFGPACEEPAANSDTQHPPMDKSTESKPHQIPPKAVNTCTTTSKKRDDNELFLPQEKLWLVVVADSSTADSDLGDSYRIVEAYQTDDCKLLHRFTMPVNRSPDFTYYISKKSYNTTSRVLCLPGYEYVFCYHMEAAKMMPRLVPQYLEEREYADAQSGMPGEMEAIGNVVFGYAVDLGAYAFDVSDKQNPRALLPLAESGQDETSLFAIGNSDGTFQAVLAYYDNNERHLVLKQLFDTPRTIIPRVGKKAANNRFIVLREKGAGHIAIDLQKREMVDLPEDVSSKSVQDILKWIRKPK